jgi:hypothetical protein
MKCPKCGTNATGKFCSNCGTALGAAACAKCGAPLNASAKFCHACGVPARVPVGAAPGAQSGIPWFLVGGAVVILVAIIGVLQLRPGAPPSGAAPMGTPPGPAGPVDLAQMTPRDAADRLFNRVMQANEMGVRDTAVMFSTMALQAYAMLDALDDDARFHVGLIQLVASNPAGALAQADTIAAGTPTHLFASMLRADAFRATGDSAAMQRAEDAYLEHFDAELAAARPGYEHHRTWLQTYRNNIRR